MTPRQQIKSLSVTSGPITARLSQEIDVLSDNNYITDAHIYCHVFLDYIWSKRKPVQGSENDRQEQSMKVEQNHMVISRRYRGQKGNTCHGHIAVSWRRNVRESGRIKDFLFYFLLIESLTFVIF